MPANTSIIRPIIDTARLMVRGGKKATDLTGYFGPGVVIPPIAPAGTEARGWNYWPFFNQNILPRPDAALTFQELRSLALYPLARICIENCKDIITAKSRQIRIKKQEGETNKDVDKRGKGDAMLKLLNDFFDCPDGEHDWDSWLRPWLEDVYVTDAASILVRRSKGNTIRELRVVDGSAISCKIDEYGYRPQPPDPAFQWLWSGTPSTNGGIPFVNLTTDQLVYRPRNIVPRNTVSSYLYGMSPTEQNAQEIELGKLRLAFWLSAYTNGNLPDMIHVVPPNISPDQLQAAQKALDSEMSGQLYKQARSIHLLQGFVDRSQPGSASGDQIIDTKEKLLVDPLDEMHIRKVAYGYGASAQRLMKQLNRASAQAGQEASEEEGTEPIAKSVKGMVDWIIARIFNCGFNVYELTYDQAEELDAVKRSTADKNDVDSGIVTRDECRQKRGLDPVGGDAAKLMITTATGTTPVEMADQVKQAKAMADAMPKPEPASGGANQKVESMILEKVEDDPEEALGHWVTLENGQHLFIHDTERKLAEKDENKVIHDKANRIAAELRAKGYDTKITRSGSVVGRSDYIHFRDKSIKPARGVESGSAFDNNYPMTVRVSGHSHGNWHDTIDVGIGTGTAKQAAARADHAYRSRFNIKIAKREGPRIDPARLTAHTRQAASKLEHAILKVFQRQKEKAGHEANKLIKLKKADDEESRRIADAIYAAIESEFASLPADARAALEQAALSGANEAWLQIEITDTDMLAGVNRVAQEFAAKRAAEMVGMKYNTHGELVANPNAKWAISDTTRDRLREIIKNSYEEGMTRENTVAAIMDADAFSEARANMIARTETSRAQVSANFDAWKASGVVAKVKWLAVGPDPCPICEDNDGVTRALGAKFPSGDIMPTSTSELWVYFSGCF